MTYTTREMALKVGKASNGVAVEMQRNVTRADGYRLTEEGIAYLNAAMIFHALAMFITKLDDDGIFNDD